MGKKNLKLLSSTLLLGSVACGALVVNGLSTSATAQSFSEARTECFCGSYEECKNKMASYCSEVCGGTYCDSCRACQAPDCCTTNNDCQAKEFCKIGDWSEHQGNEPKDLGKNKVGNCGGFGKCALKPTNCYGYSAGIDDQVCGCDGNTYDNGCEANLKGLNVKSYGACEKSKDKEEGRMCGKPCLMGVPTLLQSPCLKASDGCTKCVSKFRPEARPINVGDNIVRDRVVPTPEEGICVNPSQTPVCGRVCVKDADCMGADNCKVCGRGDAVVNERFEVRICNP